MKPSEYWNPIKHYLLGIGCFYQYLWM